MFKKSLCAAFILGTLATGCASIPMASKEQDIALKEFSSPTSDKSGLYVYRNTFVGQALKKGVFLDNVLLGETANMTYFYKEISPGRHELATESEFGNNTVDFNAEAGRNYFAEQYIKMGVFCRRGKYTNGFRRRGDEECTRV